MKNETTNERNKTLLLNLIPHGEDIDPEVRIIGIVKEDMEIEVFPWIRYNILVHENEVSGKKCDICKLELREDQKVVKCQYCEWLFHATHLFEWLVLNDDCPVCKKRLKV